MAEGIVLDASALLAVILQEEKWENLEKTVSENETFAPELIRIETANGLLSARKSIRPVLQKRPFAELLRLITEFPVNLVPIGNWWPQAESLIKKHLTLTCYDAAYLATAQHLKLAMLTLDKDLKKIAATENIPVIAVQE